MTRHDYAGRRAIAHSNMAEFWPGLLSICFGKERDELLADLCGDAPHFAAQGDETGLDRAFDQQGAAAPHFLQGGDARAGELAEGRMDLDRIVETRRTVEGDIGLAQ